VRWGGWGLRRREGVREGQVKAGGFWWEGGNGDEGEGKGRKWIEGKGGGR